MILTDKKFWIWVGMCAIIPFIMGLFAITLACRGFKEAVCVHPLQKVSRPRSFYVVEIVLEYLYCFFLLHSSSSSAFNASFYIQGIRLSFPRSTRSALRIQQDIFLTGAILSVLSCIQWLSHTCRMNSRYKTFFPPFLFLDSLSSRLESLCMFPYVPHSLHSACP